MSARDHLLQLVADIREMATKEDLQPGDVQGLLSIAESAEKLKDASTEDIIGYLRFMKNLMTSELGKRGVLRYLQGDES